MLGYRSYRHAARRGGRIAPGHADCQHQRRSPHPLEPTAGDQLLLQARTQLERRASVTARLRHQVSLDGRQLFGVGGYWQQGSGEDLRMRLELQIANQETSLLQVSNGRFLWTDQRLPAGRSITRLDLRKVRSEWSRAEQELDDLEPGQASLVARSSRSCRFATADCRRCCCRSRTVSRSCRRRRCAGRRHRHSRACPNRFRCSPSSATGSRRRSRSIAAREGEDAAAAAGAIAARSAGALRPDGFVSVSDRVSQLLDPPNACRGRWPAGAVPAQPRAAVLAGAVRRVVRRARSPPASSIFRRATPSGTIAPPNIWKRMRLQRQTRMATRKQAAH